MPVALVTGAARGIGAATCLALAAEGWTVLATDGVRDEPALGYPMASPRDLDDLARSAGGAITTAVCDVRDREAIAAAVRQAESLGELDAVIACAGAIGGGVPQWEVPVDVEDVMLDVNLRGVMHLAREGVPALLRRPVPRRGRFLAVSSAANTRGLPNLAAYCAAKAGVAGFVRALAVELGESGITVNAVSPGSTDTAMLAESARLYGLPTSAAFAPQQPIGRLLDPLEVGRVLAFLAGPGGSGMTGASVPVDGGLAL